VLEVLTRKVLTQLQTSVQQCLLVFASTPAFADAQSLPVLAQFTDECVAALNSLADTGTVATSVQQCLLAFAEVCCSIAHSFVQYYLLPAHSLSDSVDSQTSHNKPVLADR
jgi:hypothetical protein